MRKLPTLPSIAALAGAFALVCAGCSESKGNRVTGKVTFKGQPVAGGKIYFAPDMMKKNESMAGWADIKDGAYDTSARGSQGTKGGAMAVRIEGTDSSGKLIFIFKTTAELPAEATTKDFEVPESAANNVPKDSGPPP